MTDKERYEKAALAMQAGVTWERANDISSSPLAMRVGINAALVGQTALMKLLIMAGVLTEAMIMKALADEMEAEVARYEARMRRHTGLPAQLTEDLNEGLE